MKNKKTILLFGALGAALLGIFGSTAGVYAGEEEKLVVNVGLNSMCYTAFIDQELKYSEEAFADDNVEFVYTMFDGGPAILEALESGNVDLVPGIGELPTITSRAQGRDISVVSAIAREHNTFDIIIGPNVEAESVADLKDKKIGSTIGSANHYSLLNEGKKVGLTGDDFEIVNLNSAEAITALLAEEVDAVVLPENKSQPALSEGATILAKGEPCLELVLARGAFGEEHPDIVSKYLTVLQESGQYLKDHPEESAEIINNINGENIDSLTEFLKTDYYDQYLNVLSDSQLDYLTNLIQFAVDQELITEAFSVEDFYDPSYVEALN